MRSFILMTAISLVLVSAEGLYLPEQFKAEFVQKITNPKKKVITYQGKVYFSNRSLFKWDYISPTKKEVCTNGSELVVVDHDLEQVSLYAIESGFDFSKILKEAKLYKKNIYIAQYQNKRYTIQLDNYHRLHSIAYFDELDNKVQIIFKKVKYAKGSLSSKTMTCIRPKDYDTIRG